jgi:hypothetical protein
VACDPAFGTGCEPFGSKTKTTPSQNVIRRRNHIAQPFSQRGGHLIPFQASQWTLLGDLKKPERLIVVNRGGRRQAILKKG